MHRLQLTIYALFCLVVTSGLLYAQQKTEHLERSELLSGEKAMNIKVEYALGKFTLNPSLAEEAFVVDISYPSDMFDPSVGYEIEDNVGYLTVTSGEDDDRHFNWDSGEMESNWDIEYNPSLPTIMDISVGLGKGVLELGGARITHLSLENGLSETEVNFSTPNKTVLEDMDIETGLGKFRAKNLGNARFTRMDFECGLGSATLDFHGVIRDKSVAEVSVGLGSTTIILPVELGVQVEVEDSFLSSVSFDSSFKRANGYYYSPNWNEAKNKMKLKVEVGLGNASIERLP